MRAVSASPFTPGLTPRSPCTPRRSDGRRRPLRPRIAGGPTWSRRRVSRWEVISLIQLLVLILSSDFARLSRHAIKIWGTRTGDNCPCGDGRLVDRDPIFVDRHVLPLPARATGQGSPSGFRERPAGFTDRCVCPGHRRFYVPRDDAGIGPEVEMKRRWTRQRPTSRVHHPRR